MSGYGEFWSGGMASSFQPHGSLLDDLLEKGNFTLEQILEIDDVIQECKAMNTALVDYLCKPDVILALIKYITTEPPEEKANDPYHQKYQFVCSELFACELVSLFDALLTNDEAMELLFKFVAKEQPLDATLAGYFRKVIGVMIQRKYEDLAAYITQHPDVLGFLINHIDSTSIMEVLIMLGWDDGFYQHSNDVHWLLQLKFIPQIVAKLGKEFSEDIHINASYTLVDVITKSPPNQESPLMQHVQSPLILQQMLSHVFSDCESSFVHGVRVVIALLQRAVQFESEFSHDQIELISPELDAVITRLPDLLRMLNFSPKSELPTSYGKLVPPLGEVRLRAAELTCNLVQFDKAQLQQEMGKLKLLPKLLDLFFEYPWHNILHNLVESAIQITLAAEEGRLTEFRRSLIEDGKLLDRIMQAFFTQYDNEKRGAFKLGNMAFVSRISLIFVDRQDKDSEIRRLVGDNPVWKKFVDNDIERERERLMTILGGHRPHMNSFDDFDASQDFSAEVKQSSGDHNGSSTYVQEGSMLEYGDDEDNWNEEQTAVEADIDELQGVQPKLQVVESQPSS
eukprot:TRINITY_DN5259_c0_g1_i1.p1 TRINITY_DN5259_c0_g1~~TRINITY_DN5259_c0_g1_i1.p1  ORF type:complete len:568 (-),score=151.44 TRINITY_DN5259_c0_g1_i1:916-2619(-)